MAGKIAKSVIVVMLGICSLSLAGCDDQVVDISTNIGIHDAPVVSVREESQGKSHHYYMTLQVNGHNQELEINPALYDKMDSLLKAETILGAPKNHLRVDVIENGGVVVAAALSHE
jgi:uncharacterized lipoprotein YehR (DUF1307 family)